MESNIISIIRRSMKIQSALQMGKKYRKAELAKLFHIPVSAFSHSIVRVSPKSFLQFVWVDDGKFDLDDVVGIFDDHIKEVAKDGDELVQFISSGYTIYQFVGIYRFNYKGNFLQLISGLPPLPADPKGMPGKCTSRSNDRDLKIRAEGGPREYLSRSYDRDPMIRADAIRIHGVQCKVCGMTFSERYGRVGSGYIEVHHLTPLSSRKSRHSVDPKKDLVVLCANCHRMAHRKQDGKLMAFKELKSAFKK
jgi:5-methylcytosine-specific restriction endonuclease McrA